MARELCEEFQTHLENQIEGGFESNSEIFNLTTGMEMIGFSRNHHFFNKPSATISGGGGGNPSSKAINESTTSFYGISNENHLISPWQQDQRLVLDDPSLRCVFSCEANERPSQGLSLSLSSNNIGIQSFEFRQTQNHHQNDEELRFLNPSSSSRDGFFQKSNLHQQYQFQLRNSKFLAPAQELLKEFCSLQNDHQIRPKSHKYDQNGSPSSSSSSKQNLQSLEFMELQKRKAKLLSMLEEVERRYKHYCDQMKAVVSSFEAVAGAGAATVYSAMASKAMSRHFRCLRDGIVAQIQATKKAMGEKDPIAPGTTRGETPRLRILDQTLRQQKAIQQMTMMETHPWRPQRGLPERSVSVLRAWLFEHFFDPYPSDVDKHILARQTGLSRSQVSNWFINARVRLWKPMVEEMYSEEAKDQENTMAMASSDGMTDTEDNKNHNNDKKSKADQLIRIDSECLSSIISNPDKNNNQNDSSKSTKILNFQGHHNNNLQNFGAFGAVELDFSSYNDHNQNGNNQNFNGGDVSLTLGLQQHGDNAVSLAFSPASSSSLFYHRDHIDDCQQVQYSLLDGEAQNLPYRNLMGAQLLHDLAG